jgi:hypothetical protein
MAGDVQQSMAAPPDTLGYAISQRIRKRIEEVFALAKTVAGLRKMRHRGLPKVGWQVQPSAAIDRAANARHVSPTLIISHPGKPSRLLRSAVFQHPARSDCETYRLASHSY